MTDTDVQIDNLLAQAAEAEAVGLDVEAIHALEQALELGGENPILRQRIDSIQTREARGKRLREFGQEVAIFHGRGFLHDAVRVQTEVLHLTAEEIGPEWVSKIETLLAVEPELARFTHISKSNEPNFAQAQKEYAVARQQVEQFRETARRQGIQGLHLIDQVELWLHLKKESRNFKAAAAAAATGDWIDATKRYLQLHENASEHGYGYDYDNEFNRARRAMFDWLLQNVSKRQAEAREAIDNGLYDHAFQSLQGVETEFFEPIEHEFRNYRRDILIWLEEKGSPFRVEAQQLRREVERLIGIASRLEAAEAEIRGYWQQDPEKAVARLLDLKIDDPDQECAHIWKRLDRLISEARNLIQLRASELAYQIKEAQAMLQNVRERAQFFQAQLSAPSSLSADQETLRQDVLAQINGLLQILNQG